MLEPGIRLNSDVLEVSVSRDGVVTATEVGGNNVELGTLELAKFQNPGGLVALGDNMYSETTESSTPILGTPGANGFGELHQGYLEASNVDIVEEMVSMITAQRAYEINSKTVKPLKNDLNGNNLKR